MKNVIRGDIFYAQLDPKIGSEQGGYRPVLVIQNNIGNLNSPTIIIAPISTKKEVNSKLPTHVELKQLKDIRPDSIVLLEQIRVIDRSRLKGHVVLVEQDDMHEIDKAIRISLDI